MKKIRYRTHHYGGHTTEWNEKPVSLLVRLLGSQERRLLLGRLVQLLADKGVLTNDELLKVVDLEPTDRFEAEVFD